MKQRPILFSGPMVRAILEGRKTQTRRVITPQPITIPESLSGNLICEESLIWPTGKQQPIPGGNKPPFGPNLKIWINIETCNPFGRPGDRLWVKETFWIDEDDQPVCFYAATDARSDIKLKPSIFMPRELSRITLEITGVRVERLQEITYKDCEAEGLTHVGRAAWTCPGWDGDPFPEGYRGYQWLWDSINGKKHPWKNNPWVWVIEFKRI